jgi:hypothetical protein
LASTVVGCTITHNFSDASGGGAYLDSFLMDRCIVAYNYCASYGVPGSLGGGGVFATNSIIRDSLIVSNRVGNGSPDYAEGYGGGVYMQGGALLNCTVAGNCAYDCPNPQILAQQGQGAGVCAESGGVTNCIIFGNFFFGCQAIPANDLPPSTPVRAILALVENLVHQGVLNPGQGHRLEARLQAAMNAIKSSHKDRAKHSSRQTPNADIPTYACGQISAFINLVGTYRDHGTLIQAQAQPLIDDAQKLSLALGCQ